MFDTFKPPYYLFVWLSAGWLLPRPAALYAVFKRDNRASNLEEKWLL